MTRIRLVGASTVTLPIVGAAQSGPFVLKSAAEGLGPPEINVQLARSSLPRANYQGKTSALRQIILLVGLQPDWNSGQTAEELRSMLYLLLTPKYGDMVRVNIMDGNSTKAYAQGQISKLETAMFSKDPAVQITIDCDHSYLLSPSTTTQQPVQRDVGSSRAFDILNEGTAPTGFKMGVILRDNVGNALILRDPDAKGQRLEIRGVNWASGDRFVLDTRPGNLGVWRGPQGGALVSVLNNLDAKVSDWLTLYGGDNSLLLNASAFDWDPEYNFQHQAAFWGV